MKTPRGVQLERSRYPLVVLRVGSSYLEAEWDEMILGMIALMKKGPFVLITDARGGQVPNAVQRRSIIKVYEEHAREARHLLAVAVVGESTVVRGVITALNWLRPAPHPVKVFATLNAAETWLSSHLPERLRGRGPGPVAL